MKKTNNAVTPSTTVSVTNNTGTTAITLDAYDSSTGTPESNQDYALPLTVRTTSTGTPTIAAGNTVSLVLDPTRIIYTFIFARPADLFPLQELPLQQNIISEQYPPLTIDSSSPDQLALALNFYINLLVYPTSNIAQEYYDTISSAANNASSASGLDAAVNTFFQSTTNYKTLTLSAVVAAQTYARSFAYVWAGFAPNFVSFNTAVTYYLYAAGTAATGSNQAPCAFQGSLSMTQSVAPPNPADPSDRTGAYQIVYTPPSGTPQNLLFLGGQFVSDMSDFPAIALRGTFILKSTLTNNASDDVIIPILTGIVNGVQVMGTTVQQDCNSGTAFWAFFHPTTFGNYMTLITSFVGIAMGLEWIGSKAKAVYDWWYTNAATPPSAADIAAMKAQIDTLSNQMQANQQAILDQLGNRGAQVPAEAAMPAGQVAGQQAAVDANNVARGDAQMDAFEAQAAQLQVVAQYGVNEPIAKVASAIEQGAQGVQAAMPPAPGGEALQQAVDTGAENLAAIDPQLQAQIQGVQGSLSSEATAEITQAQVAQTEAEQAQENAEEAASDAGDGAGGEGDVPVDGAEVVKGVLPTLARAY